VFYSNPFILQPGILCVLFVIVWHSTTSEVATHHGINLYIIQGHYCGLSVTLSQSTGICVIYDMNQN